MKAPIKFILLFLLLAIIAGCGKGEGPDSISSHQPYPPVSGCTAKCHNAQSAISDDPLVTNGSGTNGKHIIHVSGRGIVCEKCHLTYETAGTHLDGQVDTGNAAVQLISFDTTNPGGSWINDTGLQTGSCSSLACHNVTLDWYGPDGSWILPDCSVCHSTATSSRRQIFGAAGDFASNVSVVSHHISGASDPATAQCKVCHDVTTIHMAGAVSLQNADAAANIIYDPSSPASLEPFCLSCHDADGAVTQGLNALSPFSDGRTLGVIPNEAGNKIAGYWNGSSSIHRTGGLTCVGTGAPQTGCHGSNGTINMHGSLSQGLLTKNMNFLIPLTFDFANPANTFVYNNYRLCLDCHDNYPRVSKEAVLGYRAGGGYDVAWAPTPYYTSGIQTLFRDRYIPPPASNYPSYWSGFSPSYNDNYLFFSDPFMPLHNYHLLGSDISGFLVLSWKYRGDPSQVGRITCTTCHNVHGTNGTVASVYEEFGLTDFAGLGVDRYKGFLTPDLYDDPVMMAYPINCSVSCHGIMGPTSYWYTPSGE